MFFWSKAAEVKLHFIQPGKPTQNAFVESFNGKLREYCLNLHWFADLIDARHTIKAWRAHYNDVRIRTDHWAACHPQYSPAMRPDTMKELSPLVDLIRGYGQS